MYMCLQRLSTPVRYRKMLQSLALQVTGSHKPVDKDGITL
jgi:hypothetical protein